MEDDTIDIRAHPVTTVTHQIILTVLIFALILALVSALVPVLSPLRRRFQGLLRTRMVALAHILTGDMGAMVLLNIRLPMAADIALCNQGTILPILARQPP